MKLSKDWFSTNPTENIEFELSKALKDIDEATKFVSTTTTNLAFHIYLKSSETKIHCLKISPNDLEAGGYAMLMDCFAATEGITTENLGKKLDTVFRKHIDIKVYGKDNFISTFGEDLFEEFMENKFLVELLDESKFFVPDERFISSLGQVIDWSGGSLIKETDFVTSKFNFISKLLYELNKEIKLVYRNIDNPQRNKLFYCGSDRYMPIPQSKILSLKKEFEKLLGFGLVKEFRIDNYITSVFIFFPEEAEDYSEEMSSLGTKLIPGVEIKTSDVGSSSFLVRGAFIKDDRVFYLNKDIFTRKHSGDISFDELIDSCKKKIFAEYAVIPEKLVEMSKIFLDVSSTEKLKTVIDFINKESQFVKLASKKNEILIRDLLMDVVGDTDTLTAYQLFDIYTEVTNTLSLEPSVKEKFRTCLGNIPFIDFKKLK